jgi:uncharacterized membrane protein YedE/YeeE
MNRIAALLAGLLFGAGVTLSGMVNPMKVQNFMDLFGTWDPTLIFVMGAGLIVTFLGFRIVFGWSRPMFDQSFHLPKAAGLDPKLIGGAVLFGTGWGLTGFCPGPAIASLVFGYWPSVIFVIAMGLGILAARFFTHRKDEPSGAAFEEG